MTILQMLTLAATKIDTNGGDNTASVGIPSEARTITLGSVLNSVYAWAAVVAVIVIVIAGFFYTLSQDDPQQVTRAKNAILYAVIGLVLILVAFVITQFIV